MNKQRIIGCTFLILIISVVVNARPQSLDIDEREADPGWVRRQLIRVGEAASRVGNGVGGFAVRLSNTIDRICGIIKKIIPIVGAVCTVGQFKFCAIDNNAGDLGGGVGSLPIAGPGTGGVIDLNVQD